MLTDNEVFQLIQQQKITIDPFDTKHLKAGKYEVHLGKTILVPKEPGKLIDPLDESTKPEYETIDLKNEEFILKPGMFVLGQTIEMIGLDGDVAMMIDGSTSFARVGMSVHISASVIPPGQDPHIITLEIFNAGIWSIKLSEGLRVGKLISFKFNEKNKIEARDYNQYNGQKVTTGSIFKRVR